MDSPFVTTIRVDYRTRWLVGMAAWPSSRAIGSTAEWSTSCPFAVTHNRENIREIREP
jgi:hypothetical protein